MLYLHVSTTRHITHNTNVQWRHTHLLGAVISTPNNIGTIFIKLHYQTQKDNI
jgi:hypothetical protein